MMSKSHINSKHLRLTQWLARDMLIISVLFILWHYLGAWYTSSQGAVSMLLISIVGFLSAYVSCYLVHEWGHYAGARIASADVPLGSPRGIAMGLFDPTCHSVRQFQYMSWGGVAGYTATALLLLSMYQAHLPYQAVAVGAVAFVMQSWSVDLPIILRIQQGAPVLPTASDGASASVIGRRTLQSWSVLALLLAVWSML